MEYFEKIYLDYKHQVYFFVKKFISTTEDVEDVVQEIFVHLWKHSSSLKNSQTLDSIIFKTAQQEVSNFYRKNKMLFSFSDENLIKDEADKFGFTFPNRNRRRILKPISESVMDQRRDK